MKVTTQGQVTIPAHIRKSLGILPGDSVTFVENDRGEIVLKRTIQDQQDPIEIVAHRFKLSMSSDELIALLREAS
ncbi:hypothetical protein GCM10023116_20720 [Kistimonas scapharcae]|uniref:SpoVT-AbrB domain-containing protein n=1 Tax=Kistimonas scapharcae TaxID=1036133 RepID=A0ABP8V3H1_9GAMM